jgi:hypothetical protein
MHLAGSVVLCYTVASSCARACVCLCVCVLVYVCCVLLFIIQTLAIRFVAETTGWWQRRESFLINTILCCNQLGFGLGRFNLRNKLSTSNLEGVKCEDLYLRMVFDALDGCNVKMQKFGLVSTG